jgi:K+ transporter
MALDNWVPKRFAILSDRFVNQNGILIMGTIALSLMFLTNGAVSFLVVLYSINVFITFSLSQLGIVKYYWEVRHKVSNFAKKFTVGGVGLILTTFILISVITLKFHEGGWITLLLTGLLVTLALSIKKHYERTENLLKKLDEQILKSDESASEYSAAFLPTKSTEAKYDPDSKTAVLLVNGFNGLGLHTLGSVLKLFGCDFKNFVFVQVGTVDTGSFRDASEIEKLQINTKDELEKYVDLMRRQGYYAESIYSIGTDAAEEVDTVIAPKIQERFPKAVFFGGQIIFSDFSFMSRVLHNYTIFAIQRRLYRREIPFVILPIKV